MRIEQLNDLTEDELAMLCYIVQTVEPIRPLIDFSKNVSLLLSIKHDVLLSKVSNSKLKVKDEFMSVYDGLMAKLNYNLIEELSRRMNQQNNEHT